MKQVSQVVGTIESRVFFSSKISFERKGKGFGQILILTQGRRNSTKARKYREKERNGGGCPRKFNCPPKPSVDTVSHRVGGFRPMPCSRRNQRRPDRSSGNIKCFDNGRVRDKGYTARCAAKVDRERACPLLPFPLAAKISRQIRVSRD